MFLDWLVINYLKFEFMGDAHKVFKEIFGSTKKDKARWNVVVDAGRKVKEKKQKKMEDLRDKS